MKIDVLNLYNRRAINRWERISIGDVFERVTWSFPHKEALVAMEGAYADKENKRLTYKRAEEKANQFAHALLERGLQRGDRILFYCANSVEFCLAQVGAAKAGVVAVPLNVLSAIDLVDYVIKSTEPKFLVVDGELYSRGEKIFKENGLEVGVTIPVGGGVAPGSKSFEEFIDGKPKSEPDVEIHGDDIFQILYTAGTTSLPKGVMLSHIYMYFGALAFALSHARGIPTEVDQRMAMFLPIFHIGCQSMMYSVFLVGGTVVMTRRAEGQDMAEAITQEKITTLFNSTAAFERMAEVYEQNPEKYERNSAKVMALGYKALWLDNYHRFKKIFGEDLLIIGLDGQTECVTDTRMWFHKWYETYAKNETVNYLGVPHPLYATTVMDENGNICPPNVMGEKVMRSPVTMAGYYKNEEATREAFKFGWLHGGDAAMYDDEGLLILVDRYKDIIKSGGESVASARVEETIRLHPKVANAAVIGLPHKKWVEAVTACVVPKPGEKPTEEELIAYCREKLAGYETPKKVVFVEKLPESIGGKLQKYVLRDQYKDLYKDDI